ncbi:MAG: CopG family transcriptional regulator [Alphaproteobacteria bacterium]|nr:CopG family transcriptional regulator [Alphaproteobacteria bacterium]MBU2377704.1 CopG family transcriptional regulator [Alphaproteobacteria bacterium]
MRTTLTIDDDLLLRAKAIAEYEDRSIGAVVSDFLRRAMKPDEPAPVYRNGIQLLPKRGQVITLDMVNALRDDDE